MKNFSFLVMIMLLWACSPQVKVDPEAEKAALKATAVAYQDACKIMDVQAIVSFYTSDAKVIPPGGKIATGADEIRHFMAEVKKLKNFQASFESPEVELATGGEMGYSLASAVLSFEDADGKVVKEAARDFHVWKKVDGKWKLAIDIWNAPPPPEAPPAEKSNEAEKK